MQKSRLFIAIPIPDEIKTYIQLALEDISSLPKLIPSSNYHITVIFLGEIENENIPSLIHSLSKGIEAISAFNLNLNAIIAQSNRYNHMLWASFEYSIEFEELVIQISQSLNIINKKPIPHINLIRSKKKIPGHFPYPLQKKIIQIRHIELWNSTLSPSGATYSSLASFNLKH